MTDQVATNRELPRLLTAQELEEHFGSVSLQRIYRLTREGVIPHVRLGRAIRFNPQAVNLWLSAGGSGPTCEPKPPDAAVASDDNDASELTATPDDR